jgi:cell division protein FtsB
MSENKEEITKQKSNTGFYYSFLTLILLLCLVQIGFGAILNISKMIAYHGKISTLTKIRDLAEAQNQDLKQNIKFFSSTSSLEGIARNNLKMAGEDEVLVIINNNQPQQSAKKKSKSKKREHKWKKQ